MATPYVCSESSRVGEMIITPVPEREEKGEEGEGGREASTINDGGDRIECYCHQVTD